MYDARLIFYERDRLDYRFASERWSVSRVQAEAANLKAQVDGIQPAECRRLVMAGSNPLEHPNFLDIVDQCNEIGIDTCALEAPSSAFASSHVVSYLEAAGFKEAFLVCASLDEDLNESIMRDPGQHERYVEGLKAAAGSRLNVYVIIPVLRANASQIEPMIEKIARMGGGITGVLFSLPRVGQVPESARDALLSYNEIAPYLARYFHVAQRRRLEYGLTDKTGVSPCTTSGELDRYGSIFHDRINFYKHSDRRELTRASACDSCVLLENCPGIEQSYVDHYGADGMTSIELHEALGWRLRPMNKLEQWDYKQISDFDNPVTQREMSAVRVNGHCNMACSFCFVDRTVGDYEVDALLEKISGFVDEGTTHLIVSGGEPTIHPELPAIIRGARELGLKSIEMQSNGVKSAEIDYARKLVDSGLTMVTFSLHSVNPEQSDEITRLPKAFWKTIKAMHNFRELGIRTQIACVITKMNYQELPEYVRFLREEFPEDKGHVSICFAIAQGINDLVANWVVPTFTDLQPYFTEALDYCLETDIGFGGIIGQGSYPPCMLGGTIKYHQRLLRKIYRSPEVGKEFYKADRCSECSFNDYCVGVRRSYIDQYGDAEINPLTEPVVFAGSEVIPES